MIEYRELGSSGAYQDFKGLSGISEQLFYQQEAKQLSPGIKKANFWKNSIRLVLASFVLASCARSGNAESTAIQLALTPPLPTPSSYEPPFPSPSLVPPLTQTVAPTPTLIRTPVETPILSPALTPNVSETTSPLTEISPTTHETAEQEEETKKVIKGVDIMNQAKDRLRNPRTPEEKNLLISYAKELGITHVALTTPYDYFLNNGQRESDPKALQETKEWVEAIREAGLAVSHRHMFMNFEGIYDRPKDASLDYVELMRQWMIENADLIQPGDTWTPMPEPQNGGVKGLNCEENCIFESPQEFNKFIRNAVIVSRETLKELGKEDVEVICCGFDGFVVWGDNNPDWVGKSFLEAETIKVLGHIAIDHYPQPDKSGRRATYAQDLAELHTVWPGIPIYLTEVGTIAGEDAEPIDSMLLTFSTDPLIRAIYWWQLGPAGHESLLEGSSDPLTFESLLPNRNFEELQKGFAQIR